MLLAGSLILIDVSKQSFALMMDMQHRKGVATSQMNRLILNKEWF